MLICYPVQEHSVTNSRGRDFSDIRCLPINRKEKGKVTKRDAGLRVLSER
jgi:hypothetical protein